MTLLASNVTLDTLWWVLPIYCVLQVVLGTVPSQNVNVSNFIHNKTRSNLSRFIFFTDAQCVSLPDDRSEGLSVARANTESVLVPFRENVTLGCGATGRLLRKTSSASFRQCVYDPRSVSIHVKIFLFKIIKILLLTKLQIIIIYLLVELILKA